MPFSFYERLSLQLTVLVGILLIAVTGEVRAIFWLAAFAAMFLGAVSLTLRNRPVLGSATLPTVAVMVFSAVDFIFLTSDYLIAAIHLVLLLLSLKLLGERRVADNLQMLGLSFLLVLGASAISVGATYGLLLLLYVFSGLWALLLQNLRGHWESAVGDFKSLGRRRGLLGGAFGAAVLVLGLGILLFTLAIYFVFPRIGMQFWKRAGGYSQRVSGFSDRVRLNETGKIKANPAVAVRVFYGEGKVPPEPSLQRRLRGIVLDRFDGSTWSDSRPHPASASTWFDGRRWHLMPSRNAAWNALVTPESDYASVLFLPSGTMYVEGKFDSVQRLESGNFLVKRSSRGKLAYWVSVTTQVESAAPMPSHLEVPANISARVKALAAKWAEDKTGMGLAETLSNRVTREYKYTTDIVRTDAASPIDNFLFTTKAGHCELFASSLAVLLRTRGIPTRIVNGFAGGENWGDDAVVFRESDAHTWVEAFIEGEGWVQYDPTPTGDLAMPMYLRITSFFYTIQARLHYFWSEWFIEYDQERQFGVARDIRRASTDVMAVLNSFKAPRIEWLRRRPVTVGIVGLLLVIAAGMGYRRFRLQSILVSRLTRMYTRKLRLARKIRVRQPGETLLLYATDVTRRDQQWAEFESYTRLYYKLRFGKATSADGVRFLELHAGLPRKK